jgi:hypothetical protein
MTQTSRFRFFWSLFVWALLVFISLHIWHYFIPFADPGMKIVISLAPVVGWNALGYSKQHTERSRRNGVGYGWLIAGMIMGMLFIAYLCGEQHTTFLRQRARLAEAVRSIGVFDSEGNVYFCFESDPKLVTFVRLMNNAITCDGGNDFCEMSATIQIRLKDNTTRKFQACVPVTTPDALILNSRDLELPTVILRDGRRWLDEMMNAEKESIR